MSTSQDFKAGEMSSALTDMLGPQPMVLFWEVLGQLGCGAELQGGGHRKGSSGGHIMRISSSTCSHLHVLVYQVLQDI